MTTGHGGASATPRIIGGAPLIEGRPVGVTRVGGLLTPDQVAEARSEADRLVDMYGLGGPWDARQLLGKDPCGLGSVLPGIDRFSEVFFDLARHRALYDVVESVLGQCTIPFRSQLVIRHVQEAAGAWHQDARVFSEHIRPEHGLTIVVPLDALSVKIEYCPETPTSLAAHRLVRSSTLTYALTDFAPSQRAPVVCDVEPGDVLAHDESVPHRWLPVRGGGGRAVLFCYRTSEVRRRLASGSVM